MDWKKILSQSIDDWDDMKKDEIYEELILLKRDKIEKKNLKKFFDLAQHILKYKGEMVTSLLNDLEQNCSKERLNTENNALSEEIDELKKSIELDKMKYKTKIKELTEENSMLQQRKQQIDASNFGSGGDDSPDVLSEIDRQEELLNNISAKNKHIKRLLRDIDALERQTVTQSQQINELRTHLQEATNSLTLSTNHLDELKQKINDQSKDLATIQSKNIELQQLLQSHEQANYDRELEIQNFSQQIEERAIAWKRIVEEKDERLESLRLKYDEIVDKVPGYDIDVERTQITQMADGIRERDTIISELESKLIDLSHELMTSTDLMNKLAREREIVNDTAPSKVVPTCCQDTKVLLEQSTNRAKELQEIVITLEEDNQHKATAAMDAIQALTLYQSGEDGLAQTLKQNIDLQTKIHSRDKQIRALIMELNDAQEIGQENCVLRKQLGISDDEFISTKSFTARQRKFEKINEKLTLKLRASEEIRLQLKLEKNDLRRQINELRSSITKDNKGDELSIIEENDENNLDDIKFCENCLKQYNALNGDDGICSTCKSSNAYGGSSVKMVNNLKLQIDELETKYEIVVEENENLRIGMHEILKKLRDYDAESNNIIIDSTMLQQVLHALDARSISGWYHPAMRLQNELIASTERENALKERLRCNEQLLASRNLTNEQNLNDANDNTDETNIIEQVTLSPNKLIHYANFIEFYTEYITNTTNEITDLRTKLQVAMNQSRDHEKKLIEIDVLREELKNLTETLQSSSDEKELLLAKQYEEIIQIRSQLTIEQKKVNFLHDDCQLLYSQSKRDKDISNRIQFELQKELTEINKHVAELKRCNYIEKSNDNNKSNENDQRNELIRVNLQLGNCIKMFIKHIPNIDFDNLLKLSSNLFENYAVIDDKLIIDFITKNEYFELTKKCDAVHKHNNELMQENQYLTELLTVHREQIKSQQSLLSKSSDDEITLRHLVVDMQCENNEKYIIAKSSRELQQLKDQHNIVLQENEHLQNKINEHNKEIVTIKSNNNTEIECLKKSNFNNELKLKFLIKSLIELRYNYSTYMPLYLCVDFIKDCANIYEQLKMCASDNQQKTIEFCKNEFDNLIKSFTLTAGDQENNIEDRIQLLKSQSNCKTIEMQLKLANEQIESLQLIVQQYRIHENNWSQHWQTIEMLFVENKIDNNQTVELEKIDCETQTINETNDKCINTDNSNVDTNESTQKTSDIPPPPSSSSTIALQSQIYPTVTTTFVDINTHKSMESQLKQAMILASTRSALLLETENRLAIAQGRIKSLERSLEERDSKLKADEREQNIAKVASSQGDCVLSATITSLQHLLQEKDTTLLQYQELLRAERSDRTKLYNDHRQEMYKLKEKLDDADIKIKSKDRQIEQLREKLQRRENDRTPTINVGAAATDSGATHSVVSTNLPSDGKIIKSTTTVVDYSQLSDKNIEEMFLSERSSVVFDVEPDIEATDLRKRIKERDEDVRKLQQKLRDVSNREKMWEKSLSDKDREIDGLNEKLTANQMEFKEISENISTRREIEQLREMLEEKDRHINDLTDTLTHFHDDQQRFITDTSLHSAEQVSQLSSDLSRSEATNRILNTQLEALKRQISNVCQREKQSRDLVKTLKTQLIKRPVISVKTERNITSREDNLQKRIHQLENEILITKEELRKQTNFVQLRRTKDAAELALWDKQKRFQQLSENLKQKLNERENELEKLRTNFNTAKTTIARLEREKHLMENRLRNNSGGSGMSRYCSSPSCPNLHGNDGGGGTKYTPAESPESYLTTQSEFDDGAIGGILHDTHTSLASSKRLNISAAANKDIIDALKIRIESQQRKIIAFELEGKGGNAMTNEIEKLHEKISNIEAQNLRLEAKNLQLQLDNDILRQGDKDERNRRQIKHLEDYISALKNELSQALSSKNLVNSTTSTSTQYQTKTISTGHTGQMEQTILSLRNVIERLKVENKNLKDGKKINYTKSNISKEMYDKLRDEFEKLQQLYSDALDKMSALQIELEIQNITCANCKARMEKNDQNGQNIESINLVNELQSIKEKLIQKSQLLEKAKILLTRAAAKERNFREQIVYWKRRCSELQNVPVIDEASE